MDAHGAGHDTGVRIYTRAATQAGHRPTVCTTGSGPASLAEFAPCLGVMIRQGYSG